MGKCGFWLVHPGKPGGGWGSLAITKCRAGSWLPYSIPSVLGGRHYYDYPCFVKEETEAQRG